jgi:hypothetical protein
VQSICEPTFRSNVSTTSSGPKICLSISYTRVSRSADFLSFSETSVLHGAVLTEDGRCETHKSYIPCLVPLYEPCASIVAHPVIGPSLNSLFQQGSEHRRTLAGQTCEGSCSQARVNTVSISSLADGLTSDARLEFSNLRQVCFHICTGYFCVPGSKSHSCDLQNTFRFCGPRV